MRDVDCVANVGATVGVFTVGHEQQHATSRNGPHLLVAKLPDGVEQRSLFTHLLDAVDSLVEQIELVGEILKQRDLVVECAEEDPILARLHHGLMKFIADSC